jgi:DNA-binding beta-propeller fold protein YncE
MKRTAGLAALAIITVAGVAPATPLSPQRALASAASRASSSATVPGGTQLWASKYHGNNQHNDGGAVAASPDGAMVFVTGITGLAHVSTVAYDAATGVSRWTATFYGRGDSQPSGIAVSPDSSKVFVTGYTSFPNSCCPDQFVTVAYDAASGARLWLARTFNVLHVGSLATGVAVSPDGSSVYVAGEAGKNPVVVAYDAATGAQQWVSRYQVPRGAGGGSEGVAVSPDGSEVFLTGPFRAPPAGPKFATVAYNAATGAQLWAQTTKGITYSRDVAASPDGSAVLVSGKFPWFPAAPCSLRPPTPRPPARHCGRIASTAAARTALPAPSRSPRTAGTFSSPGAARTTCRAPWTSRRSVTPQPVARNSGRAVTSRPPW